MTLETSTPNDAMRDQSNEPSVSTNMTTPFSQYFCHATATWYSHVDFPTDSSPQISICLPHGIPYTPCLSFARIKSNDTSPVGIHKSTDDDRLPLYPIVIFASA